MDFLLAAVSFPNIGVDFLRHFKLMVDPAANALVDKCSRESFATVSTLTAAAAADSGPPPGCAAGRPHQSPASSVTGLLSHRPPQSPVSSVTGLSHWRSGAAAAAAARADSGPPPTAQPAAHSSPQSPASSLSGSGVVAASAAGADSYAQLLAEFRPWSTALSGCPGSRLEM